MDLQELKQFTINFMKVVGDHVRNDGNIVILTHENADVDAYSSVVGLSFLLLRFFNVNTSRLFAYIPESNTLTEAVINKIGLTQDLMPKKQIISGLSNILLFMVDSNSISRLDLRLLLLISKIIIIDHHNKAETEQGPNILESINQKKELSFIDSSASSCAEIIARIWNILEDSNAKSQQKEENSPDISHINSVVAQLLLSGIMVDSANLRYSNNHVIPILQYLINKGADLQKNRDLVLKTIDKQERIARIKGAIRCEDLILIKDWIVLYTTVNSFEASVCKALIDLGADIAFCLSNKKGEYRLIVRTSENFSINNILNFGEFMESLGKQLSGAGGGHKGAAGLQGTDCPENLKEIVISKLKAEL